MYLATMDAATELVRSILQKESLNDCSVEELQAIAGQYSYFTPVQFLLAEKLKGTNEGLYKEQLQKLSLHFNNPLWLDYLLNDYEEENALKPEIKIPDMAEREVAISNQEDISTESIPPEQNRSMEPLIEETQIASSEILDQTKEEAIEWGDNDLTKENTVQQDSQNEESTEEESENLSLENEESQGELSISMPRLPDLNQEPTETELSFQPYHTVDYFASQGIKYVSEEKPMDHFGRQLKSFTEWLKTMKRLPQLQTETAKTDVVSEQKVQLLAEHSIDEGEVVTEAMAEVWVKQGNKEKAIETYNKLSLLNPDKSAYFASLAEQLKNS
jgi:hypothetical protein